MTGAAPDRSRQGSIGGLAASIFLAAPLGLITGPLVARALGPTGRGEVSAATVYGTMAWMLLGLGLPWAAGHRVRSEPGTDPSVMGASVRYSLMLLPVAVGLGLAMALGPLDDFSRAGVIGAFALIAVAPLNVLTNCQQAILVAQGALRPIARLRALPIVASAVATVLLAVTGTLNVATYLATTVAAGLLVDAMTWWYLRIRPSGSYPLRPLLSFGLRSVGGQLAALGNRSVDQALLAVFVGTRQLGFYAVAVTVANVPLGLGQAVAARSFSAVGGAPAEKRWAVAARYLRMSLLLGILTSTAIAIAAPVAVPLLFGGEFRASVAPLLLLLPGTAALGAGLTGVRILNAVGRPGSATLAELAGLMVTVPGLAIALPVFGISGAALVSTAAYLTRLLVQLVIMRRSGLGSMRPGADDVRYLWRVSTRSLRRRPILAHRRRVAK